MVTTLAFLFLGKSVQFLAPLTKIPSLMEITDFFYTLPGYLSEVFFVAVGKREEVSFAREYKKTE